MMKDKCHTNLFTWLCEDDLIYWKVHCQLCYIHYKPSTSSWRYKDERIKVNIKELGNLNSFFQNVIAFINRDECLRIKILNHIFIQQVLGTLSRIFKLSLLI